VALANKIRYEFQVVRKISDWAIFPFFTSVVYDKVALSVFELNFDRVVIYENRIHGFLAWI
jgi:hypothetical protein